MGPRSPADAASDSSNGMKKGSVGPPPSGRGSARVCKYSGEDSEQVMDQSAGHSLWILSRRWHHDDLSTANFSGAPGVFKRPEEAASRADSVLKIHIRRLQVLIPGGDGVGL